MSLLYRNAYEQDSFGVEMNNGGANLQVKQHTAAVNIYVNFAIVCISIGGLLTFITGDNIFFWFPFILFAVVLSYGLLFRSELFYTEKIAQHIVKWLYGQKNKPLINVDDTEIATYQLASSTKRREKLVRDNPKK